MFEERIIQCSKLKYTLHKGAIVNCYEAPGSWMCDMSHINNLWTYIVMLYLIFQKTTTLHIEKNSYENNSADVSYPNSISHTCFKPCKLLVLRIILKHMGVTVDQSD